MADFTLLKDPESFRTLSNIYDEVFCENNKRLKAVDHFRKKVTS